MKKREKDLWYCETKRYNKKKIQKNMRYKVMENVKKKHHFVFQAYLSKWKENNAVWVLRDKKKLFPTGTEAIAFKNSFYTINGLNSDEKNYWIVICKL